MKKLYILFVVIFFGVGFINAQISQDELILYLPFNSTVDDESGNGNITVNHGAVLTTDRFGNDNSAYEFNGETDFMTITPIVDVSEIGDFTVSLWAYGYGYENQTGISANFIDHQYVFDGHSYSETVTSNFFKDGFHLDYNLRLDSTETIYNVTRDMETVSFVREFEISGGLLNEWHNMVFIRKGDHTYHYFDGTLIAVEENNSSLLDMQHNWHIGTFSANNPNYNAMNYNFYGKIDDIKIFRCALSNEEVQDLYNSTNDCLVGNWLFNGNANDETFNGNDGVVYGATLTTDRFGNENSAYELDGVDDYISILPVSDVSNIGDFTFSVWAYCEGWDIQSGGSSLDKQVIFDAASNGGDVSTDFFRDGIKIQYNYISEGSSEIQYLQRYSPEDQDVFVNKISRNDLLNNWVHLAFVRSGNLTYNYVNGLLIDSVVTNPDLLDMQHEWFIGTFAGNNPNYVDFNFNFNGKIDDILFYRCALNELEVHNLYQEDVFVNSIEEKEVSVYPNPFENMVHLELPYSSGIIRVFDVKGAIIKTMNINSSQIDLDLSGLDKGIYFINSYDKDGVVASKKIIKM